MKLAACLLTAIAAAVSAQSQNFATFTGVDRPVTNEYQPLSQPAVTTTTACREECRKIASPSLALRDRCAGYLYRYVWCPRDLEGHD